MRKTIFITLLLFSILQAEEVELNLPEKFDILNVVNKDRSFAFHFKNNSFVFLDEIISCGRVHSSKISMKGTGELQKNILEGKLLITTSMKTRGTLWYLLTMSSKINGKISKDGILNIIGENSKIIECKRREWDATKFGNLNNCDSEYLNSQKGNEKFKYDYAFQLPINQPQSTQKFISDTPAESEPIQEQPQPITTPKTNLSANTGASVKARELETVEESDPCKDPNQDQAMKEYCANKAYNKKLDEEEKAQDIIDENAWEEEDKADEQYQVMLDEWYEEERQSNIAVIKENEQKRREISIKDKQRDKAFNGSIAKDQTERKAKQARKTKAQRKIFDSKMIIHQFVNDPNERKLYLDKIDALSNKDTSLQDATKIYNAARKQHYESRQLAIEAERDLQKGKAKALKDSSDFAGNIRDTAVITNKILALPAVATASLGTIVGAEAISVATVPTTTLLAHSATTNAIGAAEKGGSMDMGVSLLKDAADEVTYKFGGEAIDKGYRIIKFYYGEGIEVPPKAKLYDKNHKLLKKVKKGDKVYNDKGDDITYITSTRLMRYKLFVAKAQEDISKGDANKKANAILDVWGLSTSLTGKVLETVVKHVK